MIDLMTETLRTPSEAARHPLFRRGEQPVSAAKMWRMFNVGARPKGGGERIKLEAVQTPAGPRTSDQAIDRFQAALNGESAMARANPRRRSHDAAAEEMREAGYT